MCRGIFVEYVRREKRGHRRGPNGGGTAYWRRSFSLEQWPGRGSLLVEASLRTRGLRQILYQSHRIVFELDDQREDGSFLRIYHSSRRKLRQRDVPR